MRKSYLLKMDGAAGRAIFFHSKLIDHFFL